MFAEGYSVAFSRLRFAFNADRYAFRGLPPPPAFLGAALARHPRQDVVRALVAGTPVAAQVQALMAAAAV